MNLTKSLKYLAIKSFYIFYEYHDTFAAARDRKKGIDFFKNVQPDDLGDGYDFHKYVHYVPSKSWQIKRLIKALKINKNDAIFDYGCGKGKALYEFSKYRFKKVGGIELTNELANIAKTNMGKLGLQEVEIFNGNALNFTELDVYNHFFFFDPFSVDVFKSVINIILENTKKTPREITIIYMNLRGHQEYLDSLEGFIKYQTIRNPMKTVIYKYNPQK